MFKFKKIANKFVIPTILITALILGGFLALNIYKDKKAYFEKLNEKGESLSILLETSSKNPLWDYNFTDLNSIVKAVSEDKEVAIVNVYDSNFNWIEEVSVDKKDEKIYADTHLHHYPKEYRTIDGNKVFALEIMKNDETAGYLEVVLSDYYILENLKEKIINDIIQNVIILFLLMFIIYFISRFIVRSINKLSDATDIISSGNLKTVIDIESKDEIGQLANKFNIMTENLVKLVRKFNSTAHTLASSSEEMDASVQESSKAVKEITSGTQDIVEAAKEQSNDIDMIEKSVNDISEFFEEIASNIDTTTSISYESSNLAKEGVESVNLTIEIVKRINEIIEKAEKIISGLAEKSENIGISVAEINSISEQTKLLSLNASIEAARSGEAGKGFAVVAGEINKLADETDHITEMIEGRISEIQNAINEVVKTMEYAPKALEEGKEKVSDTVKSLSKIKNSTDDTANRLNSIKDNTHRQIEQTKEILLSIEHIINNSKASVSESEHILTRVKYQEEVMDEITAAASNLANLGEELIKTASIFKV